MPCDQVPRVEIQNGGAIQRAQTYEPNAGKAIEELHGVLGTGDIALILFFCSPSYDRAELATALRAKFNGVKVVGCTTAGEIGPAGLGDGGLSMIAFSSRNFTFTLAPMTGLRAFEMSVGQCIAKDAWARHAAASTNASAKNSFAILLVDGLSIREEQITRALQIGLGDIPLVGGSAGDALSFENTHIFYDGAFHSDFAVCIVGTTDLCFEIFKTQHFEAMDERMVVTAADSAHRVVQEINGYPAATEYARVLNASGVNLDASHFATSPVVVMIDGTNYVRSIRQANDDGSLTFFCAIEEGLVFRVAKGVGLLDNLTEKMGRLKASLGELQAVLVFDCILRRLEISTPEERDAIERVLLDHHAIGFNTYGEQYNGVHVNQTLVGIAFGGDTKHEPAR